MNERVWIAQADTTPVQNPVPLKVVTVVKPGSEQAITIDLGFDQKTKVDLSSVANEKMTMVHVGTKLIVLFDNHSTVTIEPFFDSTGKPLANLDVNLGAGHDVTGDQFASLFPITEDQSVLPAAGGGGSPASGADFHNPTVDPLAIGNPLPLLGPEELGNFQINLPLGPQSNFADTAPTITLTPSPYPTVNNTVFPARIFYTVQQGDTVQVIAQRRLCRRIVGLDAFGLAVELEVHRLRAGRRRRD